MACVRVCLGALCVLSVSLFSRFRTDNPGLWHLHCHMAHHLESGMAMLINEAPEYHARFQPPPGFPQCGE